MVPRNSLLLRQVSGQRDSLAAAFPSLPPFRSSGCLLTSVCGGGAWLLEDVKGVFYFIFICGLRLLIIISALHFFALCASSRPDQRAGPADQQTTIIHQKLQKPRVPW